MKTLIIVDMQNDFITGPLGTPEARLIEQKIVDEIDFSSYQQIFLTRDTHGYDYFDIMEGKKLPIEHCRYDTSGWEISDKIMEKIKNSNVEYNCFNKYYFGYINWRPRLWMIKPEDEIDIIGVCTDVCIVSNALILKTLFSENTIKILAKFCAGTTPEMHDKALDVMKSCQIDIVY